MKEPKTECTKCGAKILQATADRTGGLCSPCKGPRPGKVSCSVGSLVDPASVFHIPALALLQGLEKTSHVGGSEHPNRYELEAQRALVRHVAEVPRTSIRLHDDNWQRTGFVVLDLFENGEGTLEVRGRKYAYAELRKEEWQEGAGPLANHGGFLYRTSTGDIIFKIKTWVS